MTDTRKIPEAEIPSRFLSYVDKNGPIPSKHPEIGKCWIWKGYRDHKGYGRFRVHRKTCLAHRYSFHLHRGVLPKHEMHHRCENPPCVNPDHLVPLSRYEHAQLLKSAQQTHCKSGHAFTPENTLIRSTRNGRRKCRRCEAQRMRESQGCSPWKPGGPGRKPMWATDEEICSTAGR